MAKAPNITASRPGTGHHEVSGVAEGTYVTTTGVEVGAAVGVGATVGAGVGVIRVRVSGRVRAYTVPPEALVPYELKYSLSFTVMGV